MNIILNFLIIGTFISAILTITSLNPVNSVVGLIAVYVHVAIYIIGLTFNFIGLSYLIIYVGAIAILFLFVVMMMNIKYIELSEINQEYTKILPLSAIIGTLFILELLSNALIPISGLKNEYLKIYFNQLSNIIKNDIENESILISKTGREIWDSIFYSFSHIENLGHTLYSYGLLWFLLGSLILLLAMISPIVLCFDKNQN
jgi:NADH-ubiquinone oxidoreductase chain 6